MSPATPFTFALLRATDAPTFLRRALALDAIASGAVGLLLLAAAGILGPFLNLPVGLLRGVGLSFIPFVAFVAWAATRPVVSPFVARTIGMLNIVWVIASFGLLVSGLVAPNLFGLAFVAAQATVVAVFAQLQLTGARHVVAA
jgi:hypothetical protein